MRIGIMLAALSFGSIAVAESAHDKLKAAHEKLEADHKTMESEHQKMEADHAKWVKEHDAKKGKAAHEAETHGELLLPGKVQCCTTSNAILP